MITVAYGGDVRDSSKYSVSTNPSTGLYYRLHILNVGVSDVRKYRCQGGIAISYYLQLILIGMCNDIVVISNIGDFFISCW